uniref:CC domain-containing protein n=1 Tax=Panagrellus redivivus TaxID=6233 RepID=A0A7E4VGN0_PANRE
MLLRATILAVLINSALFVNALQFASNSTRVKRQWNCPSNCFAAGCSSTSQCQTYKINSSCNNGCCCTTNQVTLETACSGDAAVAGCINNLCGQGYFCSNQNYCCRCSSGSSSGPCVNGLCPAGYACNTNDYCCAIGSTSVLNTCDNGECSNGYECGQGNLCYPVVAAATSTNP